MATLQIYIPKLLMLQSKAYIGTRPILSGGFSMTGDSSLSSSAAETNLIGTGLGTLTILANTLSIGAASLSILTGNIITSAPRNLIIRIYLGYLLPLQQLTYKQWLLHLNSLLH